ncbi:hypothetical protein BCAR13_350073 [Paraburkholderia caribensis]|nr:hypothetical protein BCAR13_350073 [Paraburkholderia caribensis]
MTRPAVSYRCFRAMPWDELKSRIAGAFMIVNVFYVYHNC